MIPKFCTFFIFILLFISNVAFSQDTLNTQYTVELGAPITILDIADRTAVFVDNTREMQENEVLSANWQPYQMYVDRLSRPLGLREATIWIKLNLANSTTDTLDLVYFLNNRAYIDMYNVVSKGAVSECIYRGKFGFLAPQEKTEKKVFDNIGLHLRLAPKSNETYLFKCTDPVRRIARYDSKLFNIDYYKAERLEALLNLHLLENLFWLIMGGLVVTSFFALAQFLLVKKNVYLWYILFVAIYTTLMYRSVGIPFEDYRFMFSKALHVYQNPSIIALWVFAYIEFVDNLELNANVSPSFRKFIRILHYTFGLLSLIFFFYCFTLGYETPSQLSLFYQIWYSITFILGLCALVYAQSFNGNIKYFLTIGINSVIIGFLLLLYLQYRNEPIPYNGWKWYLQSSIISPFGVVIEVICFVLILGEKQKEVSRSKQTAERNLLSLRSRVAQDLHDDLGSEIAGITLSAHSALNSNDKTLMTNTLRTLAEKSNYLLEGMRDIVWTLNPQNDSANSLISKMRSLCVNAFDGTSTDIVFHVASDIPQAALQIEGRKHLFLFFKEAIYNIQKHAEASIVEVKLEFKNSILHMHILDDGMGFDIDTVNNMSSGNGLKNMSDRADLLKAKFDIQSFQQRGTEIQLLVPLASLLFK